MSIIPGSSTPYEVLGVGTDAQIHHTSGKKECKVAPDWQLSQVVVHRNGRSFFTGVGERDVPGAIQIWRMDDKTKYMERTNEIQAHSQPVERIRLTQDNNFLFSCGQDGLVCIFDVKDRDKMR